MILAIDVGNTNIVFSIIKKDNILFEERFNTKKFNKSFIKDFFNILNKYNIKISFVKDILAASVVPSVNLKLDKYIYKIFKKKIRYIDYKNLEELDLIVDDKSKVGIDILVGAYAGYKEYNSPLLIVDAGTAITICMIDDNKYYGGIILPGINTSFNSLIENAALLKNFQIEKPKQEIISKNTKDALNSGFVYGFASMIEGIILRIEREYNKKFKVLLTGGSINLLQKYLNKEYIFDRYLIQKGINYIYKKDIKNF